MSTSSNTTSWVWVVAFWSFIIIKAGGTALSAWSWWWVLLSIVPVLSLVLQRLGFL